MDKINSPQRTEEAGTARAGQAAPVVTLRGRDCSPGELVEELLAVLAGDPSVVVCDLGGAAVDDGLLELLDPVCAYVAAWPGTVVALCTPDTRARERLRRADKGDRLVVRESPTEAMAAVRASLPPVRRRGWALLPEPGACHDARRFITETLMTWNLPDAVEPALQVGDELVANGVVHAHSVMELRLSHAASHLRVAVCDDATALPSLQAAAPERLKLHGRGLQMVQALSRGWGVLPGRPVGKTVWAVLEAIPAGAGRPQS